MPKSEVIKYQEKIDKELEKREGNLQETLSFLRKEYEQLIKSREELLGKFKSRKYSQKDQERLKLVSGKLLIVAGHLKSAYNRDRKQLAHKIEKEKEILRRIPREKILQDKTLREKVTVLERKSVRLKVLEQRIINLEAELRDYDHESKEGKPFKESVKEIKKRTSEWIKVIEAENAEIEALEDVTDELMDITEVNDFLNQITSTDDTLDIGIFDDTSVFSENETTPSSFLKARDELFDD